MANKNPGNVPTAPVRFVDRVGGQIVRTEQVQQPIGAYILAYNKIYGRLKAVAVQPHMLRPIK